MKKEIIRQGQNGIKILDHTLNLSLTIESEDVNVENEMMEQKILALQDLKQRGVAQDFHSPSS